MRLVPGKSTNYAKMIGRNKLSRLRDSPEPNNAW